MKFATKLVIKKNSDFFVERYGVKKERVAALLREDQYEEFIHMGLRPRKYYFLDEIIYYVVLKPIKNNKTVKLRKNSRILNRDIILDCEIFDTVFGKKMLAFDIDQFK